MKTEASEEEHLTAFVALDGFNGTLFLTRNIDEEVHLYGNILPQGILSAMEVEEGTMALLRLIIEVMAHLTVERIIDNVGSKNATMQIIEATSQTAHVHAFATTSQEHVHKVIMIGVLHISQTSWETKIRIREEKCKK